MKTIKKLALIATIALVSVSCSKVLEETPRTLFVPGFFSTEAGVEGGINQMYMHLKNMYASGNMVNQMLPGTDEFTWGNSAEGGHKIADMGEGNEPWTASNSPASGTWGTAFSNINTANGVIENGEANGVSSALLAEVRFFRAFDYFMLVRLFGGVPLDLGSGELKFNTTPNRTSVRNTVDEVYEKCIFPDLQYAIENLPEKSRQQGTVTKTVARLYLAKAYLTYAWWLENPQQIPTYPPTSNQTASKAPGYFQQAYDMAVAGINGGAAGGYGLENTLYDLWKGSNFYPKEFLLYADTDPTTEQYGGSFTYSGNMGAENCTYWMYNPNFTYIQCGLTPQTTVKNGKTVWANGSPITRSAEQGYGRPWSRMAPIHDVFYNTFIDDRDSRVDVTFNLAYRQNYSRYNKKELDHVVYGANFLPVEYDGVILRFLTKNLEPGAVTYPIDTNPSDIRGRSQFGGGEMPGVAEFIIEPARYGRENFPGPWKTSVYRSDKANNEPGYPNADAKRPNIIARFAEFYFVGAEAAVKLNKNVDARNMILPIRERAGRWNYSVAEQKAVDFDYSAELADETPVTITIDWLLDEYSREFFAEPRRWLDLVRTQTWAERASTYKMAQVGMSVTDPAEYTFNRTIEKHNYLRPIPLGQINGLVMDEADKVAYQNPGYED